MPRQPYWWLTLWSLFAVAPLAMAQDAAILELDYGLDEVETTIAPYYDALSEELSRRLIQVAEPDQVRALWDTAVVVAPDAEADDYFLGNSAGLTDGRGLFYDGDYEAAIATLTPWLERFEEAPEVLAMHPDLVPVTFECMLTLVQAHDVVGDAEAAAEVLERVVRVFRYASPSSFAFDEGFIARVHEARQAVSQRVLAIRWTGGTDCEVRVNGAPAGVSSGGELHLPAGEHFVQLACVEGDSLVYRVRPALNLLELDLHFDDMVRLVAPAPTLWPRSPNAPDLLSRAARQGARTLDLDQVYTVALAPEAADGASLLEVSRWSESASSFRAVRIPLNEAVLSQAVTDAVDYLITGDVTGEVIVWQELPGWVRVNEDGVVVEEEPVEPEPIIIVEEAAPAEPIQIVIDHPAPVVERRPFQWWFVVPAALGGGAAFAATRFESQREDGVDLLNNCGEAGDGCTNEVLEERQRTIDKNASLRDLSNMGAVALGVTSVVLLVGLNVHRRGRVESSAWLDPAGGAGVSLRLRW